MNLFTYYAANTPQQAIATAGPGDAYLAGGTNLIDHLKLGIEQHPRLIDVNGLDLAGIEQTRGGLKIGANVRNSALANDSRVVALFPALSQAILSGASPQLRNAATTAGNLLQKTRCYYYRDLHTKECNKRNPGSGCAAIGGYNRIHAILGTSEKCIATHPSDMDVALMALDAQVHITGKGGERAVPIGAFYIAYGEDPAKETVLAPGELITSVEVPTTGWFRRSAYYKARDRASYEFSLSSAAVALDLAGGRIRDCRIALGGVATKPWRATAAEAALKGQAPTEGVFAAAADAELKGAKPQAYNGFKVELCRRVIVHTLKTVAEMSPG